MNFFSGRPNFASATRCVTRGGRGERSRGGQFRGSRETRKEDANESVLGLEGALVAARAREASRRLPRAARAAIARVPSRAFVRVGRCRIGTNRYDRRRSVLGVAAGTHELADATLVDEDGDGDAEDGEHAEVPRGEPEAALDDLAREPVRLDELVRHHVGGRARAGHCDASGRGRGGGVGGGGGGWSVRWPAGSSRSVARAAERRARRRAEGRTRASGAGALSGAGGGAGRTLARSWTRCADAGRSDAARARGPRGTATRYRARARAVLQVATQSREKMEHLPICVSSVRTLSRASSGRGRHLGYCPSLFAFSASCDLLPRREQRFAVPSRDSTARRDPGPGTPPPRLAAPWG